MSSTLQVICVSSIALCLMGALWGIADWRKSISDAKKERAITAREAIRMRLWTHAVFVGLLMVTSCLVSKVIW